MVWRRRRPDIKAPAKREEKRVLLLVLSPFPPAYPLSSPFSSCTSIWANGPERRRTGEEGVQGRNSRSRKTLSYFLAVVGPLVHSPAV